MFRLLTVFASSHTCELDSFFGIPHWARGLNLDGDCNIVNFELMQVWTVVGNIVEMALMLVGFLAIFFILVGAFLFITSGGNPDRIKRAKDTLLYAVIGLVVAILAVTIIRFVTGVF